MTRALLLVLLLAACGTAEEPGATAAQPGNRIVCRPAGESGFDDICTVETFDSADGRLLTVRKPDGGFRRLRVTADDRIVVAADGAEPTRVVLLGNDRVEVRIGGDSFLLPPHIVGQ